MKRIAIINQRYGLEVNGGSEYYTRLIAERLSNYFHVDVLTTKALSYEKWSNYYEEDEEIINGVSVRRFAVKKERNKIMSKILSGMIKKLGINTGALCNMWVRYQGPYVPDLLQYIVDKRDEYDIFIFVTYLYYPTVMGMEPVKDKSILIPTAHDEPYIYFKSHSRLFDMPRAIIYLTDEERNFIWDLFHNEKIPSIVAGVGVDLPSNIDNADFRKKYDIQGDYLIYVGRVEKAKGCNEMFEDFRVFRQTHRDITLVIMGQKFTDIPDYEGIKYLGFVSEEDKFNGIKGAKALWLPSQFESLSIVVLEAMTLAVPVLVNGKCSVLKGHCQKSNGGLYYEDAKSLKSALNIVVNDSEKQRIMGENAKIYIQNNYSWDSIMNNIVNLIENI